MSLWQKIVKWFLKVAWPHIRKLIRLVIEEVIKWLVKRFRSFLDSQNRQQEQKAKEKEKGYQKKAEESSNAEEAAKYEAIAKVWREVAEMYRQQNEDLQNRLSVLEQEAMQTAKATTDNLTADAVFVIKGNKDIELLEKPQILELPSSSEHD